MSGINKSSGNNIGGIAQLYYARMRDITALFDFEYQLENLTISQANLDANFSRLQFTKRNAGYDHDKTTGSAIYNNVIEAGFHKSRDEVRAHMKVTENSKLCFIFKSLNGEWLILPKADEGAQFSTGKEPINTNGYTLRWGAELTHPALPITIT